MVIRKRACTLFLAISAVAFEANAETKNIDDIPDADRPPVSLWSYFGAGIVGSYFPSPMISSAEIRGGEVKVLKKQDFQLGVGLQAFYPLFWQSVTVRSDDDGANWYRYREHAVGVYIAAALSGQDVIGSLGLGFAYSSRHQDLGLRIGAGAVVVPSAQYLADDFQEGSEVQDGVTAISYIERSAVGAQLMLTPTPGFGK